MIYNLKQKLLVFSVIFGVTSLFAQSPEVLFTGVFDGTVVNDDGSYTMPSGSQPWAGFANEDLSFYPLTFGEAGSITFTGLTDGSSADVYFKFEKNPYPDTEPSFQTASVTLGAESTEYTVDIPSQGGNSFSSFLLYITTLDVAVTLSNVVVNSSDYSGVIDVYGCLDENASNFNPEATVQGEDQYGNILCVYASCTDIPDDQGCIYPESYAPYNNFFTAASCTEYGGEACISDIPGCTDQSACNYDSAASIEDGSCEYPSPGYNCNFEFIGCPSGYDNYALNAYDSGNDGWGNSLMYAYFDGELQLDDQIVGLFGVDYTYKLALQFSQGCMPDIFNGGAYENCASHTLQFCVDQSVECINFVVTEDDMTSFNSSDPSEVSWEFMNPDGDIVASGGAGSTASVGTCVEPEPIDGIVFSGVFGGTFADANTYTNPTGSESWAGFANEDASVYPFTFGEGGSITFTGSADGDSADVYFRFEFNPHPATEPSYNTEVVTLGAESAEYTVNVPSTEDSYSSFLLYVTTPDVAVTLSNVTVNTSDTSGPVDVVGCLDVNASNYNADATVQGEDQYGNILCVYASCTDIPDDQGCIYPDSYAPYNNFFTAANCTEYGGQACEAEVVGVVGCMDSNASNYDVDATVQGYDANGNLECNFASCDDIPEYGCIYEEDGVFGAFNEEFNADLCSQYGGTPCEEYVPTVHTVIVGPGMIYTPSVLSISPGDIVNWISEGGYHDVNFDINSVTGESFGNPEEIASASLPVQSGAGEMGSITFNEVGVYNYDCSVGSHAAMGMVGSIIVSNPLVITATICQEADSVRLTGPFWEWDPVAGPLAIDNGDGTWSFTFDPAPTENMEYLLIVDGVQEDLVSDGLSSGDWSCTPVSDYANYANRLWEVGSGDVSNVYGTCGTVCPGDEPEPDPMATVEFTVDMNGVDQPSADYENVVVNGSWNGWSGWGVELSEEDGDGVFTGSLEIEPGTSFEYVVAVTGAADSWSGWGMQWSDGCTNANASVVVGDAGSVIMSSFTAGCSEALGCMDVNASNYDVSATTQEFDQYGNYMCVYASCDDIPEPGCIYAENFGVFNEEFGDSLCLVYGGIPCNSQGVGITEQTIELPSGWSMFSTYMVAYDMALDVILNPILADVIIAKDYLGAAFLPEWNFNGVGDLTVGQGYQIKTAQSTSLNISGTYMLPEENPVNLVAGWNMIGYLRTSPAAADAVLADMNASGNLIIAKDYLGAAYLPEWNFNGIGDLNPGQAYQIKVNNADVLQYNSNADDYRLSSSEVIDNSTTIQGSITITDNNMTLIIEDKAWSNIPKEGSEIVVMDDAGHIFGAAKYTPNVSVITVWGDDNTTSDKDGLFSGDQFNIKLLSDSKFIDLEVEGISSYEINSIELVSNVTSVLSTGDSKVLQRVVNVLGQDVINYENNELNRVLFMIYSDGSVEKVVK